MFVKPTDPGPIYIEPFKAEAYITAVNSPDEFLKTSIDHSKLREDWDSEALVSLAMNIYIHDKI